MEKIQLGATGLKVSPVCLGTGNFGDTVDEKTAFALLDAWLEGGGNFIDTANVYCRWVPGAGNSSERMIGAWLKSRGAKDKVVLSTKGGHYSFAAPEESRVRREAIRQDLAESLATLGLERVDLYWLHRDDPAIPAGELLGWMEELVREGRIRWYGASNFSLERMEAVHQAAKKLGVTGFSAVSNQWSLAAPNAGHNPNPDPSLVITQQAHYDWHARTGTPLLPYSASAQGYFQKRYEGRATPELEAAFGGPRSDGLYARLLEWKQASPWSVQALSIAALRRAPFPVVPMAGARSTAQLAGILEACQADAPESLFETFGAG